MKKNKFTRLIPLTALLGSLMLTAACSNNSEDKDQKSNSSSSSKISKKANSTKNKTEKTVNETKTKLKTKKIKVSQSKALNIFDKDYANKEIKEIDLKLENGNYVYEIDGFDKNREYAMTIDAHTGEIINKHSEKLDWDEHLQKGLNFDQIISRTHASKTAENKFKDGTSYEWKLEQDKNKPVWEIKIDNGHQKTEIKIDAIDNKILETEHDD